MTNKHNGIAPDLSSSLATDDFFFSTPALTQRLDLLRHLIRSGGFLLILTGEHGAGKSTLLEQLFASADPKWKICSVPSPENESPQFIADPERLPRQLLSGYYLPSSGQDVNSMRDTLFDHAKTLHDSGQIPLIVIDDIKELSPDDLQLLVELSCNEKHSSRIILVCRPEDTRRVRELVITACGDELIHMVDIPPLDQEQAGDYLHLRWNQTSRVGDNPFTEGAIRSIYHASKGLPGNINRLADQFLQNNRPNQNRGARTKAARFLNNLPFLGALPIPKVLLIAGLAGIVLLIVLLLVTGNHEPRPDTETLTLPVPTSQANIRTEPGAITSENDALPPGETSPQGSSFPSLTVPQIFTPQETATSPAPLDAASRSVETRDTKDIPIPQTAIPRTADARTQSASDISDRIRLPAITNPTVASSTITADPESTTSQQIKPLPRQAQTTPTTPPKPNPTIDNSTSSVQYRPSPERRESRAIGSKSVRTITWLQRQKPNHYTIQLLGTSKKDQMQKFLTKHNLGSQAAWFKTRHNNRDWFVVVYGIYTTNKAANIKIQSLPKALRRLKPWPRKISAILASSSGG
uniref:Cell division protein DamX, binds to the septal ring, contains C-terminal SPOR domain n=1 Tax=Candidatus Kentrum sp. MB TaxID=2138164 RepID=A0A450XU34_9GAMM|nr:MAG: Cell division protein DamX, binds to the septal ring, contains C-terminal SPOR domain [Candidatus Kentron sp. MB]VFK32810.1 MAG: Cell division protein DamX, binds to the septal ring, contains C-terminal SPOR domain [Candidatus Kentron sp. MB]VFK75787.1 MAG: Cell division protein DamX, binds to the septal ring, contains C-terminal SPOR domain [Candidatus Kentron sp. MB]